MLYTHDYTIKTTEGDIHLLFNSFFYKKYCERKGIELSDLLKRVQKTLDVQGENETLKDVKGFTQEDLSDILLTGHQTYCLYNKEPFTATELESYMWIDSLGGLVNSVGAFGEVFALFISKLLNIDTDKLKVSEGEKKSRSKK